MGKADIQSGAEGSEQMSLRKVSGEERWSSQIRQDIYFLEMWVRLTKVGSTWDSEQALPARGKGQDGGSDSRSLSLSSRCCHRE